ncbi:GTP pyrophosphokinase [Pseudomonas viridiflava]|uniref:GTP pyrophosphokinase n=1 Tax=Pseudomonas viridiflava TaxID=33069 RepID=UPI0005BD359D|nr:RelA/SpoT domain-containing protein [Pseudomonas viridiflava]MEE4333879.1 RelA/SpoT domain-containing protein [Pseudomonas alliivorans]
MDLVSEFIARYRKEYDYYEQACRMVAQNLEINLRSAGVRAIVTSRAKSPARLEAKVRQRGMKRQYDSVSAIFEDIVDLAGVRVALYFPGERQEVGRIVEALFDLTEPPKYFPTKAEPSYSKRFSGYWATHYRVALKEASLAESSQRYAEAKVEIQVASVLMHAWSEVEHDLVYKPLQGELSTEEYAILDELNGLVLSGEIALERLQRAGEQRASTQGREFTNHYDLAASLIELARATLDKATVTDAAMGRVDTLFDLLNSLGLNRPEALARYVQPLHDDFEKRPLSEQVIDQILAEDPERYAIYEQVRRVEPVSMVSGITGEARQQHEAIGEFIQLWVEYERLLAEIVMGFQPNDHSLRTPMRMIEVLRKHAPRASLKVGVAAKRLQNFRNGLVHGLETPTPESVKSASEELRELTKTLGSLGKSLRAKRAHGPEAG